MLVGSARLFLGEGLFETIAVRQGQGEYVEQHWQRMRDSATALRLPFSLSLPQWMRQVDDLIHRHCLINGVIKSVLMPLSEQRGLDAHSSKSEMIWSAFPATGVQPDSATLMTLPWQRDGNNPLYVHKTLSYMENVLARRQAKALGYDDGLYFDIQGNVLESCAANIFVIKDNCLKTPALTQGVLPGIMRQQIIARATRYGIDCQERSISKQLLMQADALFLTNSLIEILPVSKWDEHPYDLQHSFHQRLKR